MKKLIILLWVAIFAMSCNAQENKNEKIEDGNEQELSSTPKGTWKVNKEFDENGNLIQYDSIYSWSSSGEFMNMNLQKQDSLFGAMQSRFLRRFSFSDRDSIPGLFLNDSLFREKFFAKDFFDSDFGKDFLDLDEIHKRMENMQKQFMERYEKQIDSI